METASRMLSQTDDKVIHAGAAWSDGVACLASHATAESIAPRFWLEKTYNPSPMQAETRALLKAITLATTLGWRRITSKTDAQIIAQAINAKREPPWKIKHLLQDCLSLHAYFDYWLVIWISRNTNKLAHDIGKWIFGCPTFDDMFFDGPASHRYIGKHFGPPRF